MWTMTSWFLWLMVITGLVVPVALLAFLVGFFSDKYSQSANRWGGGLMLLVTLIWVAFYAYNKVFDWINTYKPKDVAGTYRLVRTTLPIPANTYTTLTIRLYENETYAASSLPDTLNIGRSGHYQLWSRADQTHPITFVNKEERSDGYFEKPGRINFKTWEDLDNPVTIAVFERISQRDN